MSSKIQLNTLRALCFAGAAGAATNLNAEDADRYRPYFKFHSGDIEPLWGVDDHWSLGLGANLNRYVGVELAFDYYLRDWGENPDLNEPADVGEASSYHLIPEIRLRYPLMKDRLVPYVIAGIGPSWIQGKDVKPWAFDENPTVEGFTYSIAAGVGLEYFIADNVTFGVEGRYIWVNPIDGTTDSGTTPVDLSAPTFTFGLRIYFDENNPRPMMSEEAEPEGRFYFGVRLGANFLTDDAWAPGAKLDPEQAAWGKVASQTGGFQLGYDFGENLGFELAVDHINHNINIDGLGSVAEYGQGWIMANFRLRMPAGRWSPYLYVGGGVNHAEVKDFQPASTGLEILTEKMHPAVNVGAGVEYFVTRNFSVGGDVRWAYSWDHSIEVPGYVPPSSGDISHLAATIGFRVYLFDN